MNPNDLFASAPALPVAGGSQSPCGCGGSSEAPATDADLLATLDAALASIESGGDVGFDGAELDLAVLDDALAQAEMLDPFADVGAGGLGLEEIVGLLERYPGLKVTLSL